MEESHDSQDNISNYDFAGFLNYKDKKFNDFIWSPDSLYLLDFNLFNYDMDSKKSDEIFETTQNKNIIFNQVKNQNNIKLINPPPSNNIKSIFTTTLTTKKRGRRKKGHTEKDGHTKEAEDNQTRKYWRIIMESVLSLSNSFSMPEKIKLTNFIQQFGCSINKNTEFLRKTIYEYFTYNTVYDDNKDNKDGKNNRVHKKIGSKNKTVINKMLNNPVYKAIMDSSIEDMFNKFINNEKIIIINGKQYSLENFKTINDIIKEKKNQLKKEKELNHNEIIDELKDYKNKFMNLVDNIKIKGPKIKRK